MIRWQKITKEEYDRALAERSHSLAVGSTLTDLDGQYGDPTVFTEWCDRETEQPVLRHRRWPQPGGLGLGPDVRPCEHFAADFLESTGGPE